MTIIVFKRNWVVHWYWAVINVLVVAILLALASWQWQRAAQKQQSLDQLAQWQIQPATTLGGLMTHAQEGTNLLAQDGALVAFTGHWISPYVWLLDNQLLSGRPGYDVVIPVQELSASPSAIVLVNLGWISAPLSRTELPEVNISDEINVQGVYRARSDTLLLGQNLEDQGRWPMRIQKIDNQLLASYLPAGLLPGLIYQQQSSPFVVHYRPVALPPERHKAYALQWLLLAVAALLVGLACAHETAYQCETVSNSKTIAAENSAKEMREQPSVINSALEDPLPKTAFSKNKVSTRSH